MKVQDVYKEPILISMPNANIRVFIPELSQEERARRMKAIYRAAESLLRYKVESGCSKRNGYI